MFAKKYVEFFRIKVISLEYEGWYDESFGNSGQPEEG